MSEEKVLMKGNEAAAEAAFRAGLDIYAGYPITPQTEILEYLSERMNIPGRVFIQSESEIAAICMLYGAAHTGKRCLTSSSGPGISLKQEGISYCAANNLPVVYINVQRGGNGLATAGSTQTEYKRETNGGGNGDYHAIILAPSTVQETADMVYSAFDIAEKYRNPVGILSESIVAQLVEPVQLPPVKEQKTVYPEWAKRGQMNARRKPEPLKVDGKTIDPKFRASYADKDKIAWMQEDAQQWESIMIEDAEYVLVAFGGPSRVAYDIILQLRSEGIRAGMIRPKTLWPYPEKAFAEIPKDVKGIISIETNYTCQMAKDVVLARDKHFKDRYVPVYAFGYICNRVPTVKEAMADIRSAMDGKTEPYC